MIGYIEHDAIITAYWVGMAFVGILCGACIVSFAVAMLYPHIMLNHDGVEDELQRRELEHNLKWPPGS